MKKNLIYIAAVSIIVLVGCSTSTGLTLSGTIETDILDINSEAQGKIIKFYKEEGDAVKKDEAIALVDAANQALVVKAQEEVVKAKEAKLADIKSGSRKEQIAQAQAQVKAAKAKLDELNKGSRNEDIKRAQIAYDSASEQYDYALDKYNKAKGLYETKAISEDELKDVKYKLDNAESAKDNAKTNLDLVKNGPTKETIRAAEASYEQAQANLRLLQEGSTDQTIKAAQADLDASKAALEQAKLLSSKYEIKSMIDGTFIEKNLEEGDIVNIGSSIGTVTDMTNIYTRVYIPQRNLNMIKLGQEVNLKSVALPNKIIKGKITFISAQAEYTPKNIETTEAKENTVFKVKIKVLDNIEVLRPGMTVDVELK